MDVYANELYHYGVQGRSGRYPWGSGARPNQRLEKPKGRTSLANSIKQKKEEKRKRSMLEEAKRKVEEQKRLDADKQRVLKEGSATEVMKYKGQLTNKELQDAVQRINLENQLSRYASAEIKSNMDKLDAVVNNVKTVTNWTKAGIETYNTLAKIYNATEEGQKNPWPMVGQGGGEKKDKDKK